MGSGRLAACLAEAPLGVVEFLQQLGGKRRSVRAKYARISLSFLAPLRPHPPLAERSAASALTFSPSMLRSWARGSQPIGVSIGPAPAVAALEHPREHPQVFAVARPEELALRVAPEPVHVVDLRRARELGADIEPVAASSRRSCSRRTAASPSDRGARRRPADGGSGRFGGHGCADEHAVLPVCAPRTPAGATSRRRPPNTSAEIGTPRGSSARGA